LNEQLQRIVLGAVTSFLAMFGGCLGTGCGTLTFGNNGEFGIKYEHNLMFVHRTAETKAVSTAEWRVPSIEEWIKAKGESETVEP